jgi:hypothetical protein
MFSVVAYEQTCAIHFHGSSHMNADKYTEYVEHPRFGKGPHYTGLDPDCNDPDVQFHWRVNIRSDGMTEELNRLFGGTIPRPPGNCGAILGTAVAADLSKQTSATIPVTHYYDEDRICRKCGRHFIFFALEQKYWYEELHFTLDSDCVCCSECRKSNQSIARKRKKYEELIHINNPSADEMLEIAVCAVTLIEGGVFSERQIEHVRAIINKLPDDRRVVQEYEDLIKRLHEIEKRMANRHS